MSIRQSRMIALINAAIDYQQALRKVTHAIAMEIGAVRSNTKTMEEAVQDLSMYSNEAFLLTDMIGSQVTIAQEHYHFKRNQKRNEWMRNYQESKRTQPRQRNIYEPPHATEQLSPLANLTPAFPVHGQNRQGDIPKGIGEREAGYTLSPGERGKLDRQIEQTAEREKQGSRIPNSEDNEEVDPDYNRTEVVEYKE